MVCAVYATNCVDLAMKINDEVNGMIETAAKGKGNVMVDVVDISYVKDSSDNICAVIAYEMKRR